MKKLIQLFASILLCQGAGIIGSLFTFSAIPTWYATLNKPFFSPPNWLFGPVWTTLYTFMGIYFYLLWQNKNKAGRLLVRYFLFHLFLNTLWSIVFFGAKQPLLALLVILVMVYQIIYLILKTPKVHPQAGYLLWPYLAWVSFATLLNAGIWLLN